MDNEALIKLDTVAANYEQMWGIDVLPKKVSEELRSKFYRQKEKLDTAILKQDDDAITSAANAMARGWHLLNSEARKEGDLPADESTIVFNLYNQKVCISIPGASVAFIPDDAVHFTLTKIKKLIPQALIESKKTFAGSFVMGVKYNTSLPVDEIPF